MLDLFSLEKRRLRGALITVYHFLKRGNRVGGSGLPSLVPSDKTGGNGMKLYQGSSDWISGKGSSPRVCSITGKMGNGHDTTPVRVQGESGQWS